MKQYSYLIHMISTFESKIVPGTTLGSLAIESIPELFPEQLWVRPLLSRHQICSRNKFGCVVQ